MAFIHHTEEDRLVMRETLKWNKETMSWEKHSCLCYNYNPEGYTIEKRFWNETKHDYLLPYLVLDRTKYMTIPIHVQYLKGSYGSVDLGATMAVIMLSIIPIILVYMFCQKHIIKGVAAGAVKG